MAKFIKEVYYPNLLADVVMVKKANDKLRMFADFIDLNKTCPNDSYPLPNQLVDTIAGHKFQAIIK